MSDARYLSGRLLLSMPGIGDPRFERAVIAMCLHDDDGALGIIINKPHGDLTLKTMLTQLEIDTAGLVSDAPVYAGGPVETGRGFVLHSLDYSGQGTVSIGGQWAMTSTIDILRAIAEGRGPKQWLVALGYAGWGAGQLEQEMTRHGWMDADGDTAMLFDTACDRRWPRAYAGMGIDVSHLSPETGHA